MRKPKYPCHHTGQWEKPIGVCERKAKKGDMWACPTSCQAAPGGAARRGVAIAQELRTSNQPSN